MVQRFNRGNDLENSLALLLLDNRSSSWGPCHVTQKKSKTSNLKSSRTRGSPAVQKREIRKTYPDPREASPIKVTVKKLLYKFIETFHSSLIIRCGVTINHPLAFDPLSSTWCHNPRKMIITALEWIGEYKKVAENRKEKIRIQQKWIHSRHDE